MHDSGIRFRFRPIILIPIPASIPVVKKSWFRFQIGKIWSRFRLQLQGRPIFDLCQCIPVPGMTALEETGGMSMLRQFHFGFGMETVSSFSSLIWLLFELKLFYGDLFSMNYYMCECCCHQNMPFIKVWHEWKIAKTTNLFLYFWLHGQIWYVLTNLHDTYMRMDF